VEVHQPDKNVMLLNESGMLTAPNILPEFKLPVKDIFPPEDEA
jgi:Uma2 family endonuclease